MGIGLDVDSFYKMVDEVIDRRYLDTSGGKLPKREDNYNGHYMHRNWVYKVLKRYPQIKYAKCATLDAYRFLCCNQDDLMSWYETLGGLFNENHYSPSQIHNVDESGFYPGETANTWRVFLPRNEKERPQLNGIKDKLTTAIECITVDGTQMPPTIICSGSTIPCLSKMDIPTKSIKNWKFVNTYSGYVNSETFLT